MRMRKVYIVLLTGLLLSCSTDNETAEQTDIIGSWDAINLQLDEQTATQDALLVRELLSNLAATNCYILSITFGADQTAHVENSFEYLDLSGLALGNFSIPCPDQSDSETGTYRFENGLLIFTDALGVQSEVSASIVGDLLYMQLEGSVYEDFINSGQLVFQKR